MYRRSEMEQEYFGHTTSFLMIQLLDISSTLCKATHHSYTITFSPSKIMPQKHIKYGYKEDKLERH
jgi:hypothetical protein